jgi:hypothetical protein
VIDRLVYRSLSVGAPPEVAMERIFQASVPNNARLEITGALGFSRMTYIQLLEGPPASLDALVKTLQADPRHTGFSILLRGASERRLLPQWSMARVDLFGLAPEIDTRLRAGDGLGLIALMATLAHDGAMA